MPGLLSVSFIPWVRNGLCGAACAQMVLSARALRPSTPDAQELIWLDIQKLTSGKTSKLSCCSSAITGFPNQIREARRNAACAICWATFPTALDAVLTDAIGTGTPVTLTALANQDNANNVIRACLSRNGIPVVLVRKGKHWVVVSNWANAGTKPVTVFDPADDAPTEMTKTRWNARMMAAVNFGRYAGKYVVVEVG